MTTFASRRVILVLMAIATCRNLMLSVNLMKKYPNWTDYLKDTHASQLHIYLTSPIEVWPGRLLENHTQLTVSN